MSRVIMEQLYAAELDYLAAGGPGTASFESLAPFFAPDVVLRQADGLPYGGVWRGRRGMELFFQAMSRAWASFDIEEQTFLATGDTCVVLSHVRAVARASGRELRFPILQTVLFEDGRIAEIRPFYWDTAAIAEVAC